MQLTPLSASLDDSPVCVLLSSVCGRRIDPDASTRRRGRPEAAGLCTSPFLDGAVSGPTLLYISGWR